MSQKRLFALAACALGAVAACCPAVGPPARPRRVALVAVAFDNRRDTDIAMQGVKGFRMDTIRLAAYLSGGGWDVRATVSGTEHLGDVSARQLPREGRDIRDLTPDFPKDRPYYRKATEANLRGDLKGLARKGALEKGDEVLVVLTGQLVKLEAGRPGKPAWKYYLCSEDTSYRSLKGLRKAADVRPDHHLLALDEIYGYLRDCPARKKLLVLVTAPSSLDEPEKYPPPLCRVLPKLPPPPEG